MDGCGYGKERSGTSVPLRTSLMPASRPRGKKAIGTALLMRPASRWIPVTQGALVGFSRSFNNRQLPLPFLFFLFINVVPSTSVKRAVPPRVGCYHTRRHFFNRSVTHLSALGCFRSSFFLSCFREPGKFPCSTVSRYLVAMSSSSDVVEVGADEKNHIVVHDEPSQEAKTSEKGIILIPQPSDDPRDPLVSH